MKVGPVAEDFIDLLVHLIFCDLLLQVCSRTLHLLRLVLLPQLQDTKRTLFELSNHVLEDLELAEESTEVDKREAQAITGKDQVVHLNIRQTLEDSLERCEILAFDRIKQLVMH